MKNNKHMTMTNAVQPAAPASIWGKGVPGKGGKSTNYFSTSTEEKKNEKEKETE